MITSSRKADTTDLGTAATHIGELLDIFTSGGVDSAFVYLFALYNLPHRRDRDPSDGLDLASLGIVHGRNGDTYPGMPWQPEPPSPRSLVL
jgi:hypothetical protein